MSSTALDRFWDALGWILSLNGEAFRVATTLPRIGALAVLIVVLAGLSQTIGQSVILFINQVKPRRFVLSLVVNAVLFAIGFFFLGFSTWLVFALTPWVNVAFGTVVVVLALSYAPLLFSF